MTLRARFLHYLKSSHGKFSLGSVLACALLLTFFGVQTFYQPPSKSYSLDFGQAEWIGYPAPTSPHAYFRKTIFLNAPVERAWLQLAATDEFEIFVNGLRIDTGDFDAACPTGLYDIKDLLREGKNVVAIHVSRMSFPGTSQVRVRGFYSVASSPVQEFTSDETWKVSKLPDGIVGGYQWQDALLADDHWTNAQKGSDSQRPRTTIPVAFPPALLETPLAGAWIGPAPTGAQQASFRSQFTLPPERRETWVQIAATGAFDVLINGRLAATEAAAPQSQRGPTRSSLALLAYNFTPWVHTGTNTILVRVRPASGPAALLADAITLLPGGLQRFSTGADWLVAPLADSFDRRPPEHALVLGQYGDAPWGKLPQRSGTPASLLTGDVRSFLTFAAILLAGTAAIVIAWIAFSAILTFRSASAVGQLWTADALIHLGVLVPLLFLWLLSFDIRLTRDWCFVPAFTLGALLLLFAGKFALLVGGRPAEATCDGSPEVLAPVSSGGSYWKMLALAGIVILGLWLRTLDFATISLDVDEFSLVRFARGVEEFGFPRTTFGSFHKDATTYELVSYFLAVTRFFFGENDTSARLPSLLFGTMSIGVIGWVGYRIFGWRAGLVSALICALHPTCMYWSRNAFWPAQGQFFVLLTVWCFYEAIQTQPFRSRYLTATTVLFICSYVTWEGSGFLLPALFVAMVARRWGDYSWLKNWHLWRCIFIIASVVLIQQSHRRLQAMPAYFQIGTSLGDITTPTVVYLDPTTYNPTYYWNQFLFIENNYVLSLVVLLGIPFCWWNLRIRFLFVAGFVLYTMYSQTLPAFSIRYSHPYLTLLILTAVGIVFQLCDRISQAGRTVAFGQWPRWLGSATAAGFVILLLLATNPFVLEAYNLANIQGYFAMRFRIYRNDYRGAAQFVGAHIQPGDAVIAVIPHVFEYYAHHPAHYSMNAMYTKAVVYDGSHEVPYFVDKLGGVPSLQSLEDLEDVRTHSSRVWLVLVPSFVADTQNPQIMKYLAKCQRVVFESYRARVILLESASRRPNESGPSANTEASPTGSAP